MMVPPTFHLSPGQRSPTAVPQPWTLLLLLLLLAETHPSHGFVAPTRRCASCFPQTTVSARSPLWLASRPDLEKEKAVPKLEQVQVTGSTQDLLGDTNIQLNQQESHHDIASSEAPDGEMSLWAARGILLLVAAIWGTNFACVKYLENLCFHPPCHHPPSEFAFARFGVAGLVSIPLLLGKRRDVILGGFECGLWITLGYVSQALALSTISSGKCAFICSLTVVFVPVVSAILYGKPIKQSDILAGLVAISGVAILENMIDVNALLGVAPAAANVGLNTSTGVAGGGSLADGVRQFGTAASSSSMQLAGGGPLASLAASIGIDKGSLLALGQPVGFGFAFTRIEATQEKFKDVPDRVLTIAAAQCVSVGILSLLWVLYDYNGVLPEFGYLLEWHRIATILWTGIVTTVFAIYLEGIALQKATATDASIAFSSEPVWASMFGYLLLGEKLGLNAYVGGTVIMTACLIGALSDSSSSSLASDGADDDEDGFAP